MKPEQVLDMQYDFRDRLRSAAFDLSIASQFGVPEDLAVSMREGLFQHMEAAAAYRVTDEMSMLVQFAASKLDATDRVDRTLLPTNCGIVRFDKPLVVAEARGRTMLAHWMTWGPAYQQSTDAFGRPSNRMAILLSFWNDTGTEPDQVWQEYTATLPAKEMTRVNRVFGRWGFIGAEVAFDGNSLGAPMAPMNDDQRATLIAQGVAHPTDTTNCLRYAHALWTLLNQTIVKVEEETLPRSAQRRIGRMPIPGRVSVITLRRTAGSQHEGETAVEWSHRWLVRGHWRWQPIGPGRKERVRIWINGYVKGPQDKPLVVTEKVYQLSR